MSCDSLSRSTEGRQSEGVQEPGESLWVEAGGNWLDAEDVWNLSRNMGSDRQLTTGTCGDIIVQVHFIIHCTFMQ